MFMYRLLIRGVDGMYIICVACGWHTISDHYLDSQCCSYVQVYAQYKVHAMCTRLTMPILDYNYKEFCSLIPFTPA